MTVWICQSGDYDARGIDGVYASLESAIALIKLKYPPPYIVKWDEPVAQYGGVTLKGHFENVEGYSTKHTEEFDFTEYEVQDTTTAS